MIGPRYGSGGTPGGTVGGAGDTRYAAAWERGQMLWRLGEVWEWAGSARETGRQGSG